MQYSQHLKTKVHYFHGELPPIIRWSTKECQALLFLFSHHLRLVASRKNIFKTINRRSAQRLSENLEKVSVSNVELRLLHVDQGLYKFMKSRLVNYLWWRRYVFLSKEHKRTWSIWLLIRAKNARSWVTLPVNLLVNPGYLIALLLGLPWQ